MSIGNRISVVPRARGLIGLLAAALFGAFFMAEDVTAQEYQKAHPEMSEKQKAEIELHDDKIVAPGSALKAGEVEFVIHNKSATERGFAIRGSIGEPGYNPEQLPPLIDETLFEQLGPDQYVRELDEKIAPGESATMTLDLFAGVFLLYDPADERRERGEVAVLEVVKRDEPVNR